MIGERWIAFTEGFWTEKSDKLVNGVVKLVNRQDFITDDDRYNMMHQINFGYKNASGTKNVGIWGYNVAKFGGECAEDDWQDIKDACDNDPRVTYGEDVGIGTFMESNNLIHRSEEEGQWLVLEIPFVSDAGKDGKPFVASVICLASDYNDTILTAIVEDLLGVGDTQANREVIDGQFIKDKYCYDGDVGKPVFIWYKKFNDLPTLITGKRFRDATVRINNNKVVAEAFRLSRKKGILEHYKITEIEE